MNLPLATKEDLLPLHRHALFFDVDGTLLEFQDRPERVASNRELNRILEALLTGTKGAVALVSGRGLDDLDRIFAPLALPSACLHGAVIRHATGVVHRMPVETWRLEKLRLALGSWVSGKTGLLLEDKGASVAVHFRLAPERAEDVRLKMQAWHAEFGEGFQLQPGKEVLEARPAEARKGLGVRELLEHPPFRDRVPVFFGDDDTDEDAFLAVQALGGCSIKIGSGPTSAICGLPDPAALRTLLRNVLVSAESTAIQP